MKELDPQKLLIAIASGGASSDIFNMYLMNTWVQTGFPKIIYKQSAYIDWNRESCVEYAIKEGYEYLMFFDNDMVFPLDIIKRLYAHDVDVVTTNYITKERPARFMCVDFEGKRVLTTEEKTGIEKVALAPTGTMLIKTKIFKDLPKPWFTTIRDAQYGEDYYFTNLCNRNGFGVYCDHDLSKEIGHEGKYIYTWKDAFAIDNFCNDKYPDKIAEKQIGL